jgi:hypothetical protein
MRSFVLRSQRVEFALFFGLVFEFLDQTCADAVETCEQTTPEMLGTPQIVAGLGVNHGQVGVSRRRLLAVIRNGVFGDVTVVNGAGLATREDDVAALVRVGGEKKDKIGLLWASYNLEFSPFF